MHGRRLEDGSVDWFDAGHMHPIKDQKSCGSCWAFSSTTAMEGCKSIKDTEMNGGELVPAVRLSEQEAVDCMSNTNANFDIFGKTYGNYGCNGGWPDDVFKYSAEQGIMKEMDYPYRGVDQACVKDIELTEVTAIEDGKVTTTIGDAIDQLNMGPMSICLAAGNDVFRFYSKGIISTDDPCPTKMDHAITLVGYGVDSVKETTIQCTPATK